MATNRFTSQSQLVNYLRHHSYLQDPRVVHAMLSVDRGNYSPGNAYADSPRHLGPEATISAPHMHAKVLELLRCQLVEGASCLEVGSGSGYLLACMKLMVGQSGKVVGVEINKQLATQSVENIKRDQPGTIARGGLHIYSYNGMKRCLWYASFNVIHVGAALDRDPRTLLDQLKVDGLLVCPLKFSNGVQKIVVYCKVSDTEISKYELDEVRYVSIQ